MPKLLPPKDGGVTVRMYRQGHGDCFLLAMHKTDGAPYYLLIDCGAKRDSQITSQGVQIDQGMVIGNIKDATGSHLDAVLVTHEHEDHLDMFMTKDKKTGKRLFDDIKIDTLILGWTANPEDELARALRVEKVKALKKLLAARAGLTGLAAANPAVGAILAQVEAMLDFEGFGADGAGAGPGLGVASDFTMDNSTARAMEYLIGKAGKIRFMEPHGAPQTIGEVSSVRLFVLGPPRSGRLAVEEPGKSDTVGQGRLYERTHSHGLSFGMGAGLDGFFAIFDGDGPGAHAPFGSEWQLKPGSPGYSDYQDFFDTCLPSQDDWQAIDVDWLAIASWYADKINTEVNNSSLVLAIELVGTGKVLLFPGDAQYGSWMSWAENDFSDGAKKIKVRDLLGRTVFYKGGHHGSHNATLKGEVDSDYANLNWFGQGKYADEFTAVIPANTAWAMTQKPVWEHPLAAIEQALREKTGGRFFKSDTDFSEARPAQAGAQAWKSFLKRVDASNPVYFDYTVLDD